ncbi:polyketide cyclase [Kytococcus schroeteri]|uniref:Polyketide cyclase n=1 Tax=Kytococcus schroeteri TaxID=138300 RepID=A0A2I1P939_9MICO|nr:polyketide cyclase [Kytococcus schroeteri]
MSRSPDGGRGARGLPPADTVTGRPVPCPAPPDTFYDLLVDPRRRPEWQSSLRRVDAVRPAGGGPVASSGTTWRDVTVVPGITPSMRLTVAERPTHWVEEGRFGAFRAWLRLDLLPHGAGSQAVPRFVVHGPLGLGRLLTLTAVPAIRADLYRAAALAAVA